MLIDYSTKLKREIKDIKQQAEIDLKKACEIFEKRCRAASMPVDITKKQGTRPAEIINWADTELKNSKIDANNVAVDAFMKKMKKEEPLVS